jgi:hypothetical protein
VVARAGVVRSVENASFAGVGDGGERQTDAQNAEIIEERYFHKLVLNANALAIVIVVFWPGTPVSSIRERGLSKRGALARLVVMLQLAAQH